MISEHREHLESLAQAIQACINQGQPFVILATGSFVGKGFDLPALDTLFLAMPISFKGRVMQYTGRLHRPFPGKTVVQVYDYVDTHSPLTLSMYRKRLKAYGVMGYGIEAPEARKKAELL
jgi:superfamily II DNA or RNA helicase